MVIQLCVVVLAGHLVHVCMFYVLLTEAEVWACETALEWSSGFGSEFDMGVGR